MVVLRRIRKVLVRSALVLAGLLLLAWIFHSPIVKWAVKKYSPEYTGRQITLERFHLNPLNGKVSMGGLNVQEAAGDSTFLHVDRIVVNLTLYKMLAGVYEITELGVQHPSVRLVQRGDRFNFSDLIDRFTSDTSAVDTGVSEPVEYALYNLHVDSLVLSYNSDLLPTPLHFVKAFVKSPQLKWNVPLIEANVRALGSDGVDLAADIGFHIEQMIYTAHAVMKNGPCKAMEPYVKPYFSISSMGGLMWADLFMRGNANDPLDFSMKGGLGLERFAMNDPNGVILLGLHAMDLRLDTVDVKNDVYRIRRFVLDSPYVFSELYDDGDNFTRLLPATDSTAVDSTGAELGYDPMNPFSMLAHYVKLVAENYQSLSYRMDSLAVLNGTVLFNDFTLEQPFHYSLTGLSLTADDINSTAKEIVVRTNSVLNTDGTFTCEIALDPATLRNMRLSYTAEGVGMPAFGPYTVHYVAHPIVSGRTKYVCNTTVVDNKLHSENRILVEDFNFGRRMQIADAMELPVRLAVSLMKDVDGNIDLDVPVEGDLDDPEYRVWPVIWQVLKNLVLKAVTAPAHLLARSFNADEEDLTSVRFLYLQQDLTSKQEKPLNVLQRVAKGRPGLRIELVQTGDRQGEAEAYAIRTAKAAYYVDSTGTAIDTTVQDLEALLKPVNIKSPGFKQWMDRKVGTGDVPVQEQCMRMVGVENANAEVTRLWNVRTRMINAYLQKDAELPTGAISVRDRAEADTIAVGGTPSFVVIFGEREGAAAMTAPASEVIP